MTITRMSLPRRTFLRGIGAAIAMPLLDAMVPALSVTAKTAANPTRRLGIVYIPMGMNPVPWIPSGEGRIAELSPSLAALMPYRDHLTVVTNLEVRNSAVAGGNHATAGSAFLSCARAKRTEGSDYELGITIDQVAAQQVGKETPIPSLELGTDLIAQVGNCDNGFACVYQNNLSWSSATTPLPIEADPRRVFERLFGAGGSPESRRSQLRANASILDWVMGDMARLQSRLGAGDRARVDTYLDSLREVERRIQRTEQQSAESPLPALERPASVPADWEEHVKLMFDLQVLALQSDMTRIITFQLAREGSTRTYPQIDVPEPHHPVSHHTNDPEKLAKLAKINAYHVSLFAYLLQRLQATADGDGTLLDHTTYLLGSGMGNPDIHDHRNLPIVLARGGIGGLKGAYHLRYPDQTPLANLHLTLLDNMGVPLERFVDSTGRAGQIAEPLSL
jgi:Protein of unknown function (DUF1552)